MQLFIHGGAHLIKLGGVGGLQLGQLRFQRLAHFGHAPGVGFAQAGKLQVQGIRQGLLQERELLAKGIDLGVLRA